MAELLERLAALPERTLEVGEALVVDGQRSKAMYVLVDGALEVSKADVRISVITEPGACFGEVGLLLETPATATVVAAAPTRVRVVEDGAALLRTDPEVTLAVAKMLAVRLNLITTFLADLREQYGSAGGTLAVVDTVLANLSQRIAPSAQSGSRREPDPLY